MNNSKYRSLSDYATKLRSSINKFDTMVVTDKMPKQMGSLKITLKTIECLLDNIIEIKDMIEKIRKVPELDSIALKDNGSAKKAFSELGSLKSDLNYEFEKQKEEFLKQMEIAQKQCRDVSHHIKGDGYKTFTSTSRDFEIMAMNAKTDIVPIFRVDSATLIQDSSQRKHIEEEKQIDSLSISEKNEFDKLHEAFQMLSATMITTKNSEIKEEIKKEIDGINKVLSPKVISVSKDGLEKLRHSKHLVLDLENIQEVMGNTHRLAGSDGKLQKINKRLEKLVTLIAKALEEERKNEKSYEQEKDRNVGRAEFATQAVNEYKNILNHNERLEIEQTQLRDNTHLIYDENERLQKGADQKRDKIKEMKELPKTYGRYEDVLEMEKLERKAQEEEILIEKNKEAIVDKMYEQNISVLPPEYTNMKKKLQSMSSLYNIEMAQQLSGGSR